MTADHQDTLMNVQLLHVSSGIARLGNLILTSAALNVLSACGSLDSHIRRADSPLPIEAIHSGTGQVVSFRAFETIDRLYVAGTTRGRFLNPYAHVDIQLIGNNGQIIEQEQDDIDLAHPRTARGRHGLRPYVASFPLSEARKATRIRVTYHNESHPDNDRG
jgi:hypothetical protein